MKAYVIPVETDCNAKCPFCITRFKNETDSGKKLPCSGVGRLPSTLKALKVDKIEITGGGEPFLHRQIDRIITLCSAIAPTQIYTNGFSLKDHYSGLNRLSYLCISRCHYDNVKNKELMGIEPDMNFRDLDVPLKFSLVLCKSGISTTVEVIKYLHWAREQGAKKVVIRHVFEYEPSITNSEYQDVFKKEYIDSGLIHLNDALRIILVPITKTFTNEFNNKVYFWGNMEIEIETRSCACELSNPVLRANRKTYIGWSNKEWMTE